LERHRGENLKIIAVMVGLDDVAHRSRVFRQLSLTSVARSRRRQPLISARRGSALIFRAFFEMCA
jgi:hypothetical protein